MGVAHRAHPDDLVAGPRLLSENDPHVFLGGDDLRLEGHDHRALHVVPRVEVKVLLAKKLYFIFIIATIIALVIQC